MPNFFKKLFGKSNTDEIQKDNNSIKEDEDVLSRYKKLQVVEEQLKANRDFEGLIKIHYQFLKLINAVGENVDRLPQIAYCLTRLGRKEEASDVLQKLADFSYMIDRDEIFRAISLVTCFTDNTPSDLFLWQINTIKSRLQHPDYCKQVVDIVFDYSDFITDTKPFNAERLTSKQNNFSNELINGTFTAMQRDNSMDMYYNKELNEIHLEDGGYFMNLIAKDQDAEMKKFQNKILKGHHREFIITGIHFLIPRLSVIEFFTALAKNSNVHRGLELYILQLIASANADTDTNSRLSKDTRFDLEVMQFFYQHFTEWGNKNNIQSKEIYTLFDSARRQIALDFLKQVNN